MSGAERGRAAAAKSARSLESREVSGLGTSGLGSRLSGAGSSGSGDTGRLVRATGLAPGLGAVGMAVEDGSALARAVQSPLIGPKGRYSLLLLAVRVTG